jgi:hypothetical protein
MPVRFRCAYCNQLLGIARRKAGSVVTCPTCAGQVIVPGTEAQEPVQQPSEAVQEPIFERSDFDNLFQMPATAPVPAAAPAPPGAWGTHAEPAFALERAEPSPEPVARPAPPSTAQLPAGIVLSPMRATVLTVAGVLALAVAFGVGILVGRAMM